MEKGRLERAQYLAVKATAIEDTKECRDTRRGILEQIKERSRKNRLTEHQAVLC